MPTSQAFERLVRFKETDGGRTQYGDLPTSVADDGILGSSVDILAGDISSGFKKTGSKGTIKHLLSPLPSASIIPCIGLNYRQHANEAKLNIPEFPVVFCKPSDAIARPYDDVHIHPDAQAQLDYEGELTVVIGRDAKNVKAADAFDHVLGYTYCYAKSFDGFAPVGPCIKAAALVDPQQLRYVTRVNGEVRQQTGTNDMIWTVRQIIEHLSRGTTLRAGTYIMTGTPSGVGLFMEPQRSGFLKDGDIVEVEVEGVGAIRNKIVFD